MKRHGEASWNAGIQTAPANPRLHGNTSFSHSHNNPEDPNQKFDKIEELEKNLKVFRAEFDVRMSIIQQILATRQEQFTVQKRLVEREETLYEKLMMHWTKAPELAASGLYIQFDINDDTIGNSENPDFTDTQEESILSDFNTTSSPGTRRRSNRRKRMKQTQVSMNEIYDADPLDDSFNIDHGHRVDVGAPDGDSGDGNDNDPPYCPEEEQEEQQQPELGHRGRRLRYTDYEKDREFASEEEAKKFVKAEEMWRLRQARETTEGKKTCYDCKFDRKCRARIYILNEHISTGLTLLYRSIAHHTHLPKLKHGLPSMIKDKIRALVGINVTTPQAILRKLREAGLPEPTLQQLANFLAAERRRLLGIKYWQRSGKQESLQGHTLGFAKRKRGRPRRGDPFVAEIVAASSAENRQKIGHPT